MSTASRKYDRRRDLQSYRNARAALKAKTKKHGLPCWICGRKFDWSLPPTHAHAWTADHVTPLAAGGHITGPLMPACRSCNSRRGDAQRTERVPTTRRW